MVRTDSISRIHTKRRPDGQHPLHLRRRDRYRIHTRRQLEVPLVLSPHGDNVQPSNGNRIVGDTIEQ